MTDTKISQEPFFVLVIGDDQSERMINLNQVRMIEKISDDHIKVMFDATFTVELHGSGASQILVLCMINSIAPDGTPVSEIWKRL